MRSRPDGPAVVLRCEFCAVRHTESPLCQDGPSGCAGARWVDRRCRWAQRVGRGPGSDFAEEPVCRNGSRPRWLLSRFLVSSRALRWSGRITSMSECRWNPRRTAVGARRVDARRATGPLDDGETMMRRPSVLVGGEHWARSRLHCRHLPSHLPCEVGCRLWSQRRVLRQRRLDELGDARRNRSRQRRIGRDAAPRRLNQPALQLQTEGEHLVIGCAAAEVAIAGAPEHHAIGDRRTGDAGAAAREAPQDLSCSRRRTRTCGRAHPSSTRT